ncbi:MAG: hypothetical protein RLZZ432_549 [Chloroflexota bacterium]
MARAASAAPGGSRRDLRLLTAGQGISLLGDAITALALPIVAVDLLGADSLGTGLLGAASTVAYLFIGLQAGVWVDRAERRRFLIAADLVRAALLLAVPAAYALGLLTLPLLIVAQAGIGAATVFFQVALPAYLPRLATGDELLRANARLSVLSEGASFVGPGIAGALISLVSAPFALVADALSFAASAVSLALIRTREPRPSRRPRAGIRGDLREGVRALFARPRLRLITIEAINGNVAFSIMLGQSIIFQRLDLGFEPALIGAISSAGFLGGLIGSLAAPSLVRRVGFGRLMFATTIAFGLDEFLQPLAAIAPVDLRLPLVAANFFLGGLFLMLYVVPVSAFRQTAVPDRLLGRIMSVSRVLTWGIGATLGYALGGVIGNLAGRPAALLVSAVMQTLVPLALFGAARTWRWRTVEEAAAADRADAARVGA